MSEHEAEPVDEAEEIAAQMTPDDQPEAPEPEPEPDVEPNLPPEEPEEPSAQSQMAAMDAYATRARKYLARNMDEVLGEEATHYVECPFCNYSNTPGFLHASPCPPELLGTVYEWTNTTAPDEYRKDNYRRACEDCEGHGEVLTGSKVRGQETLTCYKCIGRGWIPVGEPPPGIQVPLANGAAPAYPTATSPDAPVFDVNATAPAEVQDLRARGYIVIDPIATGA